jgi:hypothetical protein
MTETGNLVDLKMIRFFSMSKNESVLDHFNGATRGVRKNENRFGRFNDCVRRCVADGLCGRVFLG